ncbi:hypothetical protein NLU13_9603 [Sarocladium strictum]|uniref:SnoaL-like domain-containing protein n=1 Tax=Sarocladium strictum TaxID=5046 RepID=A0AA39GAE7_SARSR|nr:hypothetical protein NLU13_9603 [Sarocladium strictum]
MSTLAKVMRATAEAYLNSFVRASRNKDIREISVNCTDDCQRLVGPASFLQLVGAPLDLKMSNAEYESQFGTMAFYNLQACIISKLVVDEETLRAAAKSELIGEFVDGRKISRTNVWFLDFTADGTKICKVYQHLDFHEALEFRRVLAEYKRVKNEEE